MAQSVFPVYLLSGPEVGRKREAISSIQKSIEKEDGEQPEKHHFYPYDTDTGDVIAILRNGSLFSSRRMVLFSDAHALKAADLRAFKEYIAAPSPESVLIFSTDQTPGARDYPRGLADALPKTATRIFWEMFERDKKNWVMHFMREKGLRIADSAADLLLDITEGTSDALREACERLAFSTEAGSSITEAMVDKALEHGREETVYSLFDRFCRRDLGGALDAFRKMVLSDPAAADRMVPLLTESLIRLLDFAALAAQGMPGADAARNLKLRGGKRSLRAYSKGAENFSQKDISTALRRLIDMEAWLRTAPRELHFPRIELWLCKAIGLPMNPYSLSGGVGTSGL